MDSNAFVAILRTPVISYKLNDTVYSFNGERLKITPLANASDIPKDISNPMVKKLDISDLFSVESDLTFQDKILELAKNTKVNEIIVAYQGRDDVLQSAGYFLSYSTATNFVLSTDNPDDLPPLMNTLIAEHLETISPKRMKFHTAVQGEDVPKLNVKFPNLRYIEEVVIDSVDDAINLGKGKEFEFNVGKISVDSHLVTAVSSILNGWEEKGTEIVTY